MKSIALREIKSFFGSPIGYLVIAIFLLLNGLFLWVFDGEYNILQSGFADLSPFFTLAPWILIFLIPAVTMRSFSDEKKQGTIELLLTKPLSVWQIVNGKFLAALVLIVMAIIPTLIYVVVVSNLGMTNNDISTFSVVVRFLILALYIIIIRKKIVKIITESIISWINMILVNFRVSISKKSKAFEFILLIINILILLNLLIFISFPFFELRNIDMGSTMGSYFGLLFLIAAYTAIGIFTSTLSENQIVAFLLSVFLCFLFYYGFEGASVFLKGFEDAVARIGMDYHFKSMARGVIDTRDVLYFISVAFLFLSFTVFKLKSLKS